MNSTTFNGLKSVRDESGLPYRFKDLENCMLQDSIWVERQDVDNPILAPLTLWEGFVL